MQQTANPKSNFISNNLPFLLLSLVLTVMYLSFYVFEARFKISLQTDSPQNTYFKVYWADKDQAYSEGRMAQLPINNQQQVLELYIADLDDIERIRIDPAEYPTTVLIKEISLSQPGYETISLSGKPALQALSTLQQIKPVAVNADDGVVFQTTSDDGQLELKLRPVKQPGFPVQHLLTLLAMLATLALMTHFGKPILKDLRFVPYLLGIAFVLALIMALSTGLHVHPDESVHLSAVNYYANHLLPPPLDAEAAEPTFSIYGRSRLSNYESYYPLAGYVRHFADQVGGSALINTRLFSLGLFALLIIFAARNTHFRPFALPMLLSAQLWYVLGYANSDSFALILSVFVSYQAAYSGSMLNRFLSETSPAYYFFKLVGLGALLGILLLNKINYAFYALFLGLYFLWRIRQGHFSDQKRLWSRIALLVLIAGSLYGARFAMDISANGWNRVNVIAQMQEKYAAPPYKASTELSQQNPMLHLRQQGKSLGEVVVTARWFEKTFVSAFGVYGFSEYFAKLRFYDFVRYAGLLLLVILLIGGLRHQALSHLVLLLIIGVCVSGLAFSIIWHSWNTSFQAQGRYFMPALPMLGIFYSHVRHNIIPYVIEWLSIFMFGLAVYSFIFVGLREMAGITFLE